MSIVRMWWQPWAAASLAFTLAACRGGGGGNDTPDPPPGPFTVSATVSGLAGSGLVLRNNGGNDTGVAANGVITFSNAIPSGGTYAVTVATQPSSPSQTCNVANASGTVATANVANVMVTCVTNTYSVAASVSNLAGTGLVLRNNGGDDLAVATNGVASFATPVASGGGYAVTVATQPTAPSQTCSITNGSGTVTSADVIDVAVDCVTNRYTVSATVTNLLGSGLVLRNNNGDELTITASGTASFATTVASGAAYAVTVDRQPALPMQVCTVNAGGGTVESDDVEVQVTCGPALYLLGGMVTGLVGNVTLANGSAELTVSQNGAFSFGPTANQSPYSISVANQPVNYTCSVSNGTGVISGADASNVGVSCAIDPPGIPMLTLNNFTKRVTLQWTRPARAAFYRVHRTRNSDTDYQQLGGDLLTDTFDDDLALHLTDLTHLRYRVEACNVSGCTSSSPGVPQTHLNMIGYFKASNSRSEDWFGLFTAVSGDGQTIAVSAPSEDSSSTTVNGPGQSTYTTPNSGAVYVYMRDPVLNRWVQQAHIKPSGSTAGLGFGWGITLSHDGNTLAVGVQADSTGASNSGSVYVFARTPGTTFWTEQAHLRASNFGQDDLFGYSLALTADGDALVIGAPGESSNATGVGLPQTDNNAPNSGAAYVFGRTAGVWTQRDYIKASNTGNSDSFGSSVAIAPDGSTLAISAPGEDSGATGVDGDQGNSASPDSGAVYVFVRSGSSWAQQAYLKSPDSVPHPSSPGDQLGAALALSGNGDTLAVSSIHESSNARGIGGNPDNNDAQDSGAAYVFVRQGTAWSMQAYIKSSNSDAQDMFGFSLDLSDDGNVAVIAARGEASSAQGIGGNQADNSAFGSGAVYAFRRSGGSWSQVNYVHGRGTNPGDLFGCSLALSADGETLIVGAYGEDGAGTIFNGNTNSNSAPETGAAYIY
jgi:hypothetical protein